MIGNRAFTLPDMGGTTMGGANGFSLLHNDSKNNLDDHPIHFFAPELPAETLLDVSFFLFIRYFHEIRFHFRCYFSFSVITMRPWLS